MGFYMKPLQAKKVLYNNILKETIQFDIMITVLSINKTKHVVQVA